MDPQQNCPNCGAQDDDPAEVIPSAGRDVQCSNCGKTWFQPPANEVLADEFEDLAQSEAQMAVPALEDDYFEDSDLDEDLAQDEVAEDEASESFSEVDAARYDPDVPAAASFSQAVNSAKTGRSTLTDDVASVLREEVAFEQAAREAERNTPQEILETQADLGLDDPEIELKERIASLESIEDRDIAVAGGRAARRDLLPDVEEINSTLRTNEAKVIEDLTPEGFVFESDEYEYEVKHRKGFRWGFVGSLSGIAAAILLYVYAEPLKARTPQLSAPIDTYVGYVDLGRREMDNALLDLGVYVQTLMAQATQAVNERTNYDTN